MICNRRELVRLGKLPLGLFVSMLLGSSLFTGCSRQNASSTDAAPGVTPPAHIAPVPLPTTAPGHVSGAMKARQELEALKKKQ